MEASTVYVLGLMVVAVVLFVSDRLRSDMVAMIILGGLLLPGIITPEEGFSGFGHPATVAVAAMFVLSAGLERTGAVANIGELFARLGRRSPRRALLGMMVVIAVISAFINNTAAVAILLPPVLTMARRLETSPSKLLIPLSFASLFGGSCTLIGTSTNLLVSSMAEQHGEPPIGMFELSLVGLVLAVVGLAYMATIGSRLLPDRGRGADLTDEFDVGSYLTELEIPAGSTLVGATIGSSALSETDVDVLAVVRQGQTMTLPRVNTVFEEGDVLWVRADLDAMKTLRAADWITIRHGRHWEDQGLESFDATIIEAVVAPGSFLIGKTLEESSFRNRFGATVLAIRHHDHIHHNRLTSTPLSAGDALLIEAPKDQISRLKRRREFVVVSDVGSLDEPPRRKLTAMLIVAAVVAATASGALHISASALAGAILLILTGTLRLDEAYRAIDWQVVFLLGGILPLGIALEKTGGAALLAGVLIDGVGSHGPLVILAALYLATTVLTAFMSNTATAALLVPIALTAASTLGIDPRPLLVAIAFGASASFMTPVGYQTNLLVYGPGSYRFSDYIKVGVPLTLIFWVLATLLIPIAWPF
ncbi:MAG: SLC13 family permease [Thermoanaerobaculales bacterium]|jgi:di/tricarboxylate transporter|nr:SLC13 family permease [Thermoanaerobaculales bacterium]